LGVSFVECKKERKKRKEKKRKEKKERKKHVDALKFSFSPHFDNHK
jgi:hypothetical protein